MSGITREVLFAQDQIDLAVYYGKGKWPGLKADLLFHNELFPVCTPKLLVGKKDLSEVKFIYVTAPERQGDCPLWLEAAGLPEPEDKAKLHFLHTIQALQAAEKGMGIAISHSCFVEQSMKTGQLVVPVDIKVQDPNSYYLVYPRSAFAKRKSQTLFENLVINNRKTLLALLNINPAKIVYDNPYHQTKTQRIEACKIDYLIQDRHNIVHVVEIKFSTKKIGAFVIDDMKRKIAKLKLPLNFLTDLC